MVYKILISFLLLLIWLVFSGLFDAFHTTLGVFSIGLVVWMSSDLMFQHRNRTMARRLGEGLRLTAYLGWLLWQIFLANLHILRLVLSPKGMDEVKPSIIKFKCGLKTDFEKFLLANSITLTPGTVTLKILGDTYYVHAISNFAAEGLDGEMERRIKAIYRLKEEAN